jgi:hypothetical protein
LKAIAAVVLCTASLAHAQMLPAKPAAAAAPEVPEANTLPAPAPEPTQWWKRFEPFGYAKVGVFYTLPTRDEQIPGGNGGFRMLSLRLGTIYKPIDDLEVVASIEGAAPQPRPEDPTSGTRVVQLRDAYAEYKVCSGLLVRAGQFKAPFWAETLLPDGQLPFTTRSVISEGYTAPEFAGQREGLTLDRQVGVQLSSRRLGTKAVGFKYAVAVVNGNGANQLLNENNTVAPVGRLELELFEHLTLGANAYYNQRTDGGRPNRLTANQFGYGADINAHAMGFNVLVGYVGRSTTYSELAPDTSLGILGQVGYLHEGTGLGGGVRFALLDPSAVDPSDNVTELSVMLSWQLKSAPLRVLLQFTHRDEANGVAVANDDLDAMLQVAW